MKITQNSKNLRRDYKRDDGGLNEVFKPSENLLIFE